MNKLAWCFIAAFLFCASFGGFGYQVIKGSVVAATAGDPTLFFQWNMESDTPALAEDNTPTFQSGAARTTVETAEFYDGVSSLTGDGTSARVEFSTAKALLANGKVKLRVKIGTFSASARFWQAMVDTSNSVIINCIGSASDIRVSVTHTGAGTGDSCTIPVASGRVTGEWFYFEAGWKEESEAGNDMYVKVCDADGVTDCVIQEVDADPVAAVGTLSLWSIGSTTSTALLADTFVDAVEVFDASGY